jgi:hypothetical protein
MMTDKKEIAVYDGRRRIGSAHPSLDGLTWGVRAAIDEAERSAS